MSDQKRKEEVRQAKLKVLLDLSKEEQRLLSRVLRVEAENLHMERPRVKDDLLKIVREEIL